MSDTVMTLGNSVLQHGKYNDRIYLMKLSKDDLPTIADRLDKLALSDGYSRIIAKVPASAEAEFADNGYVVEARIPKFYNGGENLYFMGKYFSELRKRQNNPEKIRDVLKVAESKVPKRKMGAVALAPGFDYGVCDKSDAVQISSVYKTVFETYPFPIHDPEYVARTMDENFIYFSIRKNGRIVALSSSEMDASSKTVEMTDFATLPEHQKGGFAIYLLQRMEDEMRKLEMKTAYTIARAVSYGINAIFAKMGYKYGGTLTNNTNISGSLESMNIWYKPL